MQLTTNKLTLKQLLNSSNEQFVIPGYQRRYAWTIKQQKALFDDIYFLKEEDNHLLGMILCHTGNHTGGLNQAELVDGQQRLTTISILLLAIRNKFTELKIAKKADEIEGLIYSTDLKDNQLNKIILGDLDNLDYIKIIGGSKKEEITNPNLWAAFTNFEDWIREWNIEELSLYYNKLINIAVIIRLDASNPKDAYKLFESINNRGLRLSPTDLIKNFILGHASKIDVKTLDSVKLAWSKVITNLDGIDTNQFLRQYMCMLLKRRVTMEKLVEDFKSYYINNIQNTGLISTAELYAEDAKLVDNEDEYDDEDDVINDEVDDNNLLDEKSEEKKMLLTDFLQQLKDASLVYRKIRLREFNDERINQSLLNLQRILSFPSYIFLLNLFQRQEVPSKLKLEVMKIIETFMLRRHICQKRTGELDNIFAQLVIIEDTGISNNVKNSLVKHFPSDIEFEDYFPRHLFKGKLIDRARYVLEQIEYYLLSGEKEYKLSSPKELHLEHIIPQVISTKKAKKEYGDWVEYLGENSVVKHKRYVSRIGNLTLLSSELNIKASNNPFNNKKDNYKKSNLMLNQSLSNHFRQFKFQQVEERGRELTKMAMNIWKF